MFVSLLAFALVVSPAHAGKKKDAPPAPPPAAAAPAAAPAIDPAFEADIRKLLAVTGAASMGQQMMDQMFVNLRPLAPTLPDAFWTEAKTECKADELIELIVPIYARHLGPAEVKELIAFYESPTGQKLVSVQPAIMQESMAAGQAWGQEVGMRIALKIQGQQGAPAQ